MTSKAWDYLLPYVHNKVVISDHTFFEKTGCFPLLNTIENALEAGFADPYIYVHRYMIFVPDTWDDFPFGRHNFWSRGHTDLIFIFLNRLRVGKKSVQPYVISSFLLIFGLETNQGSTMKIFVPFFANRWPSGSLNLKLKLKFNTVVFFLWMPEVRPFKLKLNIGHTMSR